MVVKLRVECPTSYWACEDERIEGGTHDVETDDAAYLQAILDAVDAGALRLQRPSRRVLRRRLAELMG